MIKDNGTYYIFYTGSGISVKTSTDRITWKNAGKVFSALPAWHKQYVPDNTGHLWAPDIHFRGGKFWLYYSISTGGSRVSAMGLATTTALNPVSGATVWQDQGMVLNTTGSNDYNAIDPNVYVDSAGVPWFAFGSWWTGLKMFKLDPVTGKRADQSPLLSLASRTGSKGIEAAFIIRRNQYHYLFASWDVCCDGANSTYNIRVGRSSAVTGPYADSKGVLMTNNGGDLIDAGDSRWKGPGHNAIFTENDTTFLVNHAYDAQNNGQAMLWIRPLYFTPAGWPTLTPQATTAIDPLKPLARPGIPEVLSDAQGRRLGKTRPKSIQPLFSEFRNE